MGRAERLMSELPKPPAWWQPITDSVPLDGLGYAGGAATVVLNPLPAWLDAYFALDQLEGEAFRAARAELAALLIPEISLGGQTVAPAEVEEADQRVLTLLFVEMLERRAAQLDSAVATFRGERATAQVLRRRAQNARAAGAAETEEPAAKPADAPSAAAFKRRYSGGDSADGE